MQSARSLSGNLPAHSLTSPHLIEPKKLGVLDAFSIDCQSVARRRALTWLSLGAHAAGDPAKGEMKFYTCYGCHGIANYRNAYPDYSVPKLRHQNAEYLVAALQEYRDGDAAACHHACAGRVALGSGYRRHRRLSAGCRARSSPAPLRTAKAPKAGGSLRCLSRRERSRRRCAARCRNRRCSPDSTWITWNRR